MALAQKQFSDLITFTRGSDAGCFNVEGAYVTVAANQPRFDYDPATKLIKGLLIEESQTNLLINSQDATKASWVKIRSSAAAYEVIGGLPFTAITASSTDASGAYVYTSTDPIPNPVGSVFVKKGTKDWAMIIVSDGAANGVRQWFNLATGQLGSQALFGAAMPSGAATIQDCGGFYRLSLPASLPLGAVTRLTSYLSCPADLSIASTVGDVGYISGTQIEAGTFASSYIPTVGTQVTRASDMATMSVLSPWYSQEEGTLFVDYNPGNIGYGATCAGAYMSSETPAFNLIALRNGTGQGQITAALTNGIGATQFSIRGASGVPVGARVKMALAIKSSGASFSVNGGAPATFGAFEMPKPTKMGIGRATSGQQYANGHIRSIRYYPRRLTSAELQALTS